MAMKGMMLSPHCTYESLKCWKQHMHHLRAAVMTPFVCVKKKMKKRLILMYHYESIFLDGQGWLWVEVEKQPIQPKGQGRGIMVSDFIDEYNVTTNQ
jgi:hypothetical protein